MCSSFQDRASQDMTLKELCSSVSEEHVFIQEGSKFILKPEGISGIFQIGHPMLPFKLRSI